MINKNNLIKCGILVTTLSSCTTVYQPKGAWIIINIHQTQRLQFILRVWKVADIMRLI